MADQKNTLSHAAQQAARKKEKLAAKLRENLKRRKQQTRTLGLDPASGSRGAFSAFEQDASKISPQGQDDDERG